VRVIREFHPVAVKEVRPDVYVLDFGQEFTGWCRLKVDGPAGTQVRLRHAEVVSPDGNLDVGTLMGTVQTEDYLLDGKGERTLEPHFTYPGFRYVELSGLPAQNTTMWEAFNALAQNLSLNHWTHSAASEWLWRNVAGLNPEEQHPGYQSFTIRPRVTKEVSWCKASYDSIRGQIVSDWKLDGNLFTLRLTVPANTSATGYCFAWLHFSLPVRPRRNRP
jgi:hypothetical protein